MGLGDNRRSPKMRRKVAQAKLKARIERRRAVAAKERAATKKTAPAAPAPATRKADKKSSSST